MTPRARAVIARFMAQLSAYGGIERTDFLDLSDHEFNGFVHTLWWGRRGQ